MYTLLAIKWFVFTFPHDHKLLTLTYKKLYIIHACIIIFIVYSLPYFICIIAVILNTLYACYGVMSHCFTLVCRKIAQMS